jgi:ABC-type transport system involved in multi-copper enzyme maturation permease subunit
MTTEFRIQQALTITRMELRRVFFSKRSFWVYGLALFPALIFFAHGLNVREDRANWEPRKISPALVQEVEEGQRQPDVRAKLGDPIRANTYRGRKRDENRRRFQGYYMMYYDGQHKIHLNFEDGILVSKRVNNFDTGEEDRQAYSGVFQYFYLRLAIFFGCLGIFMNLFRGELLDKTLHFWFLAPVRREVLLAGKFLAGLTAATVIFTAGTALSFGLMIWGQPPADARAFWAEQGPAHLVSYVSAAALACLGYGSVFLAAGLLVRNPVVVAMILSFWEGMNSFLPVWMQKLSVLYYVQSLCPTAPPMDSDTPALLKLLLAPAQPAEPWVAVAGLLALSALVLWAASRAVRRLEINYGTD